MRRQNTEPIADVIRRFLQEEGLEKPFLEHRLVEAWPELMGPLVKKYTGRIEIRKGVLWVEITSAALRQELFIARDKVVKKLNEHIEAEVITDIRFI